MELPQATVLTPAEWRRLLASLPRGRSNLRGPADEGRLAGLRHALGRCLPASFESFLRAGDGGWIGPERILGTRELAAPRPPDLPPGLLPFHPVGQGFDCLDLRPSAATDWSDAPVVWWDPTLGAHQTHTDFTDWVLDHLHDLTRR